MSSDLNRVYIFVKSTEETEVFIAPKTKFSTIIESL